MPYGKYGYYASDKGDWKPGDRVRVKWEYQGKTWAARAKRQGDWIVDKFLNKNWELKRPDDWKHIPGYPKRLRAKPHQLEAAAPPPKATTEVKKTGIMDFVSDFTAAKPSVSPTGHKSQDPPLQSVPPPKPTKHIHVADEEFVQKFVEEMTKDDPPNLKSAAKEKIESKSGITLWGPNGETSPFAPKPQPSTPTAPSSDFPQTPVGSIVIVKDPHGTIPKGKLFMVVKQYGITVDIAQLFVGTTYAAHKSWLTVLPEKDLTITYLPK